MPLFKRQIIEADQFKVKFGSADSTFPGIALSQEADQGIYKKSETSIGILINSTDTLDIKKGELAFVDGGAIDGSTISLFISGGSLQYKGSNGTITRLAIP